MSSRQINPNRFSPVAKQSDLEADSALSLTDPESSSDDTIRQSDSIRRSSTSLAGTEPRRWLDDSSQVTLWLRRSDQFLLGFLLIALLVLLIAFRWKLSGGGRAEIEIVSQQPREYYYAIDINKASWVEWAQLDGIGEKLGRRIVKDREDRGPFEAIDDLRRVRGIGPKVLEKLRPFLRCVREEERKP